MCVCRSRASLQSRQSRLLQPETLAGLETLARVLRRRRDSRARGRVLNSKRGHAGLATTLLVVPPKVQHEYIFRFSIHMKVKQCC